MKGEEDGFVTPEDAARADIPPQFVRVVGVQMDGHRARVSLLTNEAPRFDPYQVDCERRDGRWFATWGSGGFQTGTPDGVKEAARRQGWRGHRVPDVTVDPE
jgi:hypothetical protein